jgi:hypothetical protein
MTANGYRETNPALCMVSTTPREYAVSRVEDYSRFRQGHQTLKWNYSGRRETFRKSHWLEGVLLFEEQKTHPCRTIMHVTNLLPAAATPSFPRSTPQCTYGRHPPVGNLAHFLCLLVQVFLGQSFESYFQDAWWSQSSSGSLTQLSTTELHQS